MKYFLLTTLFIMSLYSNEDIKELEGIFFKMGLEALINDFENEKNTTKQQQKMLEYLQKKVLSNEFNIKKLKEIYGKNNKMEPMAITIKDDTNTLSKQANLKNYEALQNEIELLQKELENYKNIALENQKKLLEYKKPQAAIIKKKIEITDQNAVVVKDKIYARKTPYVNADIVEVLAKDTKIQVQSCDKYGWCKLHNKEAYVAKYLIKFIKKDY